MSITIKIKLNESIIPCIPFIWYREQELVCPIDYIGKLNCWKIKNIFNMKDNLNNLDDDEQIYTIIQRNISDSDNLYICLHSLLYYELHKSQEMQDNLLIIPNNFNKNATFEVIVIPLNDSEIKEIRGGIRINNFANGSVFIHDCAFSPPGCLHFKVNLEKQCNTFLCNIKCQSLNININSLFILFNDLRETNIENEIKNLIASFDYED